MLFAEHRIKHDLKNISLLENISIIKSSKWEMVDCPINYIWKIIVKINLIEGPLKNYSLNFDVNFTDQYPFEGPKIVAHQNIFHPNIFEKKICLSILREDWLPVYSIEKVLVGLNYILVDPFDCTDPYNTEAANLLIENKDAFIKKYKNIEM